MPVDYANLVTFRASSATDEVCVSATLFSEKNQRIVSVNNFRVEFKPEGTLLYIINKDVPGVVGKVGTALGDHEINIAEYNLARELSGGKAHGDHHRRLRARHRDDDRPAIVSKPSKK